MDTYRQLNPNTVKYSYWNLRSGAREKNQGWRLDYFVVSGALMTAVLDSEINNEYHGSDHCPLSLILDLTKVDSMDKMPPFIAKAPSATKADGVGISIKKASDMI